MKLQDCKDLSELVWYSIKKNINHHDAILELAIILQRAAEIGGEKVKEAAASAIEDGVRHSGLYTNTLIRALNVKQIIEGE